MGRPDSATSSDAAGSLGSAGSSDAAGSQLRLPPEMSRSPASQTMRWFFRPLSFMQEGRRRYGEIFGVRFLTFTTPMYLISDPVAIKTVYSEPANTLPPGRELQLEPLLGPRSILLQEGSEHLARRKLMLPPFHGERMRSYEAVVREAITTEMESWRPGEPFPIHPRMQSVTLEVILRAVFGVVDGPRYERLRAVLGRLLDQVASPGTQLIGLLSRRPTEYLQQRAQATGATPLDRLGGVATRASLWVKLRELLDEVDRELYAEIADHREDPGLAERTDILSMLLSARFADGEGMSDAELRDQLMTLLLAGHETTATALAWTFDMLLRHPAALAQLREEVDAAGGAAATAGEAAGAADAGASAGSEGASGDEYLRATISEALRLRPVIPIAGRVLAEETEIDGYRLPAGTNVAPSIWMAHTRQDVYPDPFAFRPERFLDSPPDTYAWIPFGGGVRRCLGAAFAEFEMRIVIGEVLRNFNLNPVAGTDRGERVGRRNITLSPRDGTPLTVTRRAAVLATPPIPA
ncbi:MAG TPA: cytochrome P450 [Solirubrobacterales bacterium]|nr:cytochrome P450 [Solirubrobacterales bacterium]